MNSQQDRYRHRGAGSGRYQTWVEQETTGPSDRDKVDVDVELDTAPREVTVPVDFARALSRDAAARHFFEGMSLSNKQRILISVEAAKTPETRERRIAEAVSSLYEGRV